MRSGETHLEDYLLMECSHSSKRNIRFMGGPILNKEYIIRRPKGENKERL